MKFKRLLIALPLLFLGGCATLVPEDKIVNFDPENMELPPGVPEYEPTPDHIEIANADQVLVFADKGPSIVEENNLGNFVEREVWYITARNESEYHDKCVTILWRLMDFKLYTTGPSEFFIGASDTTNVGVMVGQVWEIDGVQVALPPSGYVHKIRMRPPAVNAVEGEECLFLSDKVIEK